jgi:hypothetical protein
VTARRLIRWWRSPFWVLALATGAKSFADNPVLGSERLNRRGLHIARLKLAHRFAWARRRRLAGAVPGEWRAQFDRDGFVVVPNFLPDADFDAVRSQLSAGTFDTREQQQGDTITRRIAVGPDLLAAVPGLGRLLADRRWKSLLAYVASTRSEPLYYIQTIVTHAADAPADPQLELHADTFHPSMKAWLFLTDVEAGKAPLTYVAGSHRLTPERLVWEQAKSVDIHNADRLSQRGSFRIRREELGALDLPQPTAFAVPANTLVVIDTSGFHARGPSDAPTVRVELWAYCRRSPFLPWTGLDMLSVGPLAMRRASWLGVITDRLDRLGLKKQHWRPTGRRSPFEA